MRFNRKKINELALHVTDGEHTTVIDDALGEYYLLSNKNIRESRVIFDDSDRKINFDSFKKINKRTKLEFGDVVIATVGSIGKTAIIRDKNLRYDFQRSVGIIKTNKDKLTPEYLHYYFQLPFVQKRLINLSSGAVQKCLFISDLKKIEIDIPDKFYTQKSIAKVLSDLDAKIELNNRINRELETMAKTLYDYWFLQFDFPNEQGKPYKSSGGKMVYIAELKREIPEEWEVKRIGDILYTALGGTPSTAVKEYWDKGNINWLNSGEVANFPIIDSELKVTEVAINSSATELLPKGSVLISITRHLRPSILAIDACANQSVIGIKENGDIKSYYLYPFLKNEIPRLNKLRTGAQQPHINKETIEDSYLIIPSEKSNVLVDYNKKVKPFYEMIINNAFQNKSLSELRDWLLPMLMNGQVTVKEAEERLSMAAESMSSYKNRKE